MISNNTNNILSTYQENLTLPFIIKRSLSETPDQEEAPNHAEEVEGVY